MTDKEKALKEAKRLIQRMHDFHCEKLTDEQAKICALSLCDFKIENYDAKFYRQVKQEIETIS